MITRLIWAAIALVLWGPTTRAGPVSPADYEKIARAGVFDGHLHALPIWHPVAVDMAGTLHFGVGLTGPLSPRVAPSLTLGGDFQRKIIRLPTYHRHYFHLPANEQAYLLIRNDRLEVGVGAGVATLMPDLWNVYANLTPRIGGSLQTEKYVMSADEDGHLALPFQASDCDLWSIGDSLTYSARAGLSAGAGVGFTSLLRAGIGAGLDGDVTVSIRKLAHRVLELSITRNGGANMGGVLSIPLAYVQEIAAMHHLQSQSYVFELDQAGAATAYRELLWGRAQAAIDLAGQPQSGVSRTVASFAKAHGHGLTTAAGLPLVHMSELNRKRLAIAALQWQGNDSEALPGNLAFLTKTTSTSGVASHHYLKHRGFYTMMAPAGPQSSRAHYQGLFKWLYEDDDTDKAKLTRELALVQERLGVASLGKGFIEHLHAKNRGYARFDVSLGISEADLKVWARTLRRLNRQTAHLTLRRLIAASVPSGQAPLLPPLALWRRNVAAQHRLAKITKDAKLLHNLDPLDPKRARYLTHLGYHLTKDRFAFRYLLGMLEHPLELSLEIMGEAIPPYYQRITIAADNDAKTWREVTHRQIFAGDLS